MATTTMATLRAPALLLLLLVAVACAQDKPEKKKTKCFVCTSYMTQCQQEVKQEDAKLVYSEMCDGPCFIREADDGEIYRGCMDGFKEVEALQYMQDASGCLEVRWPEKTHQWCLCKDGDHCNRRSMQSMGASKYENYVQPFAKEATSDTGFGMYQANYVAPFEPEPKYVEEVKEVNHASYYEPQNSQVLNDYVQQQATGYAGQQYQPQHQELEYPEDNAYMYPPYKNSPPYGPPRETYHQPAPEQPQHSENEITSNEAPEAKELEEEKVKEPEPFPEDLAGRIHCAKTGYYQNPDDCRTFVACIMNFGQTHPYMYLMRCPEGLVWDNKVNICMEYSTTCNVGLAQEPYVQPHNYQQPAEYEPTAKEYEQAGHEQVTYQQPAAYEQQPASYEQQQVSYEQPANYEQQQPTNYEQPPAHYEQQPAQYEQKPVPHNQQAPHYDQQPAQTPTYEHQPPVYEPQPPQYEPVNYEQPQQYAPPQPEQPVQPAQPAQPAQPSYEQPQHYEQPPPVQSQSYEAPPAQPQHYQPTNVHEPIYSAQDRAYPDPGQFKQSEVQEPYVPPQARQN